MYIFGAPHNSGHTLVHVVIASSYYSISDSCSLLYSGQCRLKGLFNQGCWSPLARSVAIICGIHTLVLAWLAS